MHKGLFITVIILYHFVMRIVVGETVTFLCKNHRFSYDAFWFRPKKYEKKLYELLKVKRWKKKLITAKPNQFDLKKRSLEELLFNMTQAELSHGIMIPLSFMPMLFNRSFVVCLVISILASMVDIAYIIIQRFNRPRVQALIKKHSKDSRTV